MALEARSEKPELLCAAARTGKKNGQKTNRRKAAPVKAHTLSRKSGYFAAVISPNSREICPRTEI
jgi:hypothetical protein